MNKNNIKRTEIIGDDDETMSCETSIGMAGNLRVKIYFFKNVNDKLTISRIVEVEESYTKKVSQ